MNFDLTYFMSIEYPMVIKPIPPEDGGGWSAEILELKGCCADGETPEEAMENLKYAKEAWLKVALERGINIPLPQKDVDDEYSGKFTLRIPKAIHKELALRAAAEGISLNQYVGNLIAYQLGKASSQVNALTEDTIEQLLSRSLDKLYKKMCIALHEKSETSSGMHNNVQVIHLSDNREMYPAIIAELSKLSKKNDQDQWRMNDLEHLFSGGNKRW